MNSVRVCLAQFSPRLNHRLENRDSILRLADEAANENANAIVFPELSLTGYCLREIVPDVALTIDDPFWHPLLHISQKIALIIGFVLETGSHQFYNAAACLMNGEFAAIHKKTYLPNYGAYEEGKWFARGTEWAPVSVAGFRCGLLICEESWHLSPAYSLFLQHADALLILTNSSTLGKPVDDVTSSAQACKIQNRFYARMLGAYVCFVNRAGEENGLTFWGGSECISPEGRLIAAAGAAPDELLYVTLHREIIRQARIAMPLRRDELSSLLLPYLSR